MWEPEPEDRPTKRRRSVSPQPEFIVGAPTELKHPWGLPVSDSLNDSGYQREMARLEEGKRKAQVADILARAAAAAEAAAIAPAPQSSKDHSSQKKSSKPKLTKEEKEAAKEKQLQKLVSPIVVKCMSKYKDQMDHDTFKKHAKEVRGMKPSL